MKVAGIACIRPSARFIVYGLMRVPLHQPEHISPSLVSTDLQHTTVLIVLCTIRIFT